DIVIMSRIDNPGQNDKFGRGGINSISGVAFSGDQGISRVEVSQDGGKSWAPAELKDALSPYTWVFWVYNWEPSPGKYNLLVRAADKKGLLQKSAEREPYPDGATGYHSITVRIV
ncbi:MAG: Ig-like domain-containing protein, partial [Dehalococcoidia bacterium]|nr:Ig-like domain-containing protein [Dehalococcoidia bacterium]